MVEVTEADMSSMEAANMTNIVGDMLVIRVDMEDKVDIREDMINMVDTTKVLDTVSNK